MGLAIVQTNSEYPSGKVTWMQKGDNPINVRNPKEEVIYRIPDNLVDVGSKQKKVAGFTFTYFEIEVSVIEAEGIKAEADIGEFLAAFFESELMNQNPETMRFILAVQLGLIADKYKLMNQEISAYKDTLTAPNKTIFEQMLALHKMPQPPKAPQSRAASTQSD